MAGVVIFGGYTILDFNRLRGAGTKSAMPIAARFLDVFNVVLFVRQLVGGERE
jgi:FtsH-binding integral membrane protein